MFKGSDVLGLRCFRVRCLSVRVFKGWGVLGLGYLPYGFDTGRFLDVK